MNLCVLSAVSATLLSRSIREGGFCLFFAINRELNRELNREFFLFEHRWRAQSPYRVEDLCCLAKINRELSGKYQGRLQMNSACCAFQSRGMSLSDSFLMVSS